MNTQTQTPAAPVAKDLSNAGLLTIFQNEVSATRGAIAASMQGGIKAIAYSAVLGWQAAAYGATRKGIAYLILGSEKPANTDGGQAKMYRGAMRLAAHWRLKGLPDDLRTANSFDAGVTACLAWFELHSVSSVEGLNKFLDKAVGIANADKKPSSVTSRVVKAITRAAKQVPGSANGLDVAGVGQMGKGLVDAMSLTDALAFAHAVSNAIAAKNRAAEEAAAAIVPQGVKAA